MQEVSVKQTGPISTEIDFLVSKADVEAEFSKYCNEIKDKVLINGFRKGTTPVSVIKQKFSNEIKTEVSARLIHKKTEAAIKDKNLKLAGNPSLKKEYKIGKDKPWIGHFKLDGGFEYGVEAELEPSVTIENYKGIEVTVDLPNPAAWVEGRVAELQNTFAEKNSVDRPIKIGDEVALDFTAEVDGQKLDEGLAKWHTSVIGSGDLTKEFEENIIGKLPGTHTDFSITFSGDFEEKLVAGKKVDFSVNIHTAIETILHPVNNELAQKAVYENVEQMRSELNEKAVEEFEKPRKAKILDSLMTTILEKNPFMVPNAWVDNEMRVIAHRLGMTKMPEDTEQLNGLREIAHRSVQQSFILDQIYQKEESIHLSKEDIEAVLAKEAARTGRTSNEILSHLKNSGTYEGFISFSEHTRTTDFLIAAANIKEKA